MNFDTLKQEIKDKSSLPFTTASEQLEERLFKCSKTDLLEIILNIGAIPEDISHDSTEEKLYTKVSDIVFAKSLMEMGYSVRVLKERADSADIIAESRYHGYSLVGDAKAFRLSRTAKNAKDFKVKSMAHWRGDCDYAVLVCPYFQYPRSKSQIYKDALDENISLFSWELIYIVLKENIVENTIISLKELWNQSAVIASETSVDGSKRNFLEIQNSKIIQLLGISQDRFIGYCMSIKQSLIQRGQLEIAFYDQERTRIQSLNHEEAINELLQATKIDGKIRSIQTFITQLPTN